MAGQINIDSTDIEETLSMLGDSVGTLEGDTYSYVNDNYDVLEDLGLVDNSVTKVKKQIDELVRSQNKVIVDLKNHLETYYQTENEIVDYIKNFEGGFKENNTIVDVTSEYTASTIDNVSTGKNVTKGDAVKFIKSVSEGMLLKEMLLNSLKVLVKKLKESYMITSERMDLEWITLLMS